LALFCRCDRFNKLSTIAVIDILAIATIEKALLDLANLKSIDPTLDLGDGISIEAMTLGIGSKFGRKSEEYRIANQASKRGKNSKPDAQPAEASVLITI
jgi:hypothetical protein